MMPFDEGEQECLAFLYEIYKRSAGDARQGIPYEVLIEALGLDERVIKRIQRELQREGLVELTTVPQMTTVCRPVMDNIYRQHHQQTIAMTQQGVCLLEDVIAMRRTEPPDHSVG
jgi:RNA-binding protein YhbY